MCGIFGYIGPRDSTSICIRGLKSLEYRGYDSAGIAGLHQGALHVHKQAGSISALESSMGTDFFPLDLAIAHTRWATHGEASKENAHPHFDEEYTVAVVHNGIIENHFELRKKLEAQGVSFTSDTDSEIIAQLIAQYYEGNFLIAVQKSLKDLKGLWGIAAIHKLHPDMIIAAANENPIAIAFDREKKEAFVASDANAFQEGALEVFFLNSGEMAVITTKGCTLFNSKAEEVDRIAKKLSQNRQMISKNGYPHFMLKEIFEQPQTLRGAMKARLLPTQGTAHFEELLMSAEQLLKIERIVLLGCGTSWHAGSLAALLLEDLAKLPAHAEIASEFRYNNPCLTPNTLVIAISQSGETMDTIAAVREAKRRGAKILGICNEENSTLSREADSCLFLNAGPEVSVCSTKAFTSQIVVLSLFTLMLARLKGMDPSQGKQLIEEMENLPDIIALILAQKDSFALYAKKYASFNHAFFLGRSYMYIAALESALKLKEISYINANAYPAGEMKHGPIALIDENLPTIAFLGNAHTEEKILSNLMEIKARKGKILCLAPEEMTSLTEITPDVIFLPKLSDTLAPIAYAVAGQLLAYYVALERGTDIDKPRNLAKAVTVE